MPKKKKDMKIASLKNIGDGISVGPGYKKGKDKALDAAIERIRRGEVPDSSGFGNRMRVKNDKKKKKTRTA